MAGCWTTCGRAGALPGLRDDLLRDFDHAQLVQAIEWPTRTTPLAEGQDSPRQKYRFYDGDGVAETIAREVSPAPLGEPGQRPAPGAGHLHAALRVKPVDSAADREVTSADLEAIGGVDGGLKAFAEDALHRSMGLTAGGLAAFRGLFAGLFHRQADGSLTTWLAPRGLLEAEWTGPDDFSAVLEKAKTVRLLREDRLIDGDERGSSIRLGHDWLARVAAAWKREFEEEEGEERARRRSLRRWGLGNRRLGRRPGFARGRLELAMVPVEEGR